MLSRRDKDNVVQSILGNVVPLGQKTDPVENRDCQSRESAECRLPQPDSDTYNLGVEVELAMPME